MLLLLVCVYLTCSLAGCHCFVLALDFKDVFTPEAANATAYSNNVVGTNTWQWWNKERGEWAVYAITVAAKQPSEEPPMATAPSASPSPSPVPKEEPKAAEAPAQASASPEEATPAPAAPPADVQMLPVTVEAAGAPAPAPAAPPTNVG